MKTLEHKQSMYTKIIDCLNKLEFKYIVPLILISLYPRIKFFLLLLQSNKGLPKPPDTIWYLDHARSLITKGGFTLDFNGLFYLGYYSLLAFLLKIFGTQEAVVFIQIIINAVSVVLVYKIGELLFNRRTGLIAGAIYAYTWQIIYWTVYLLTDTLFISVLLLTVYLLLLAYKYEKRRYWYMFIISSTYMMFFRPTGIISLAFIFIYILLQGTFKDTLNFIKEKKKQVAVILGIILLFSAALLMSGKLNPLFASLKKEMRWLMFENYATGHVFDWKTPYDYKFEVNRNVNFLNSTIISFIFNNWIHIFYIYIKRAVFFWAIWIWNYSNEQIWESIRYFVPVYTLAFIGIINIVKQKIFRKASIIFLVILSIQFFCIVFFMDISFRYRAPSLVFLDIIAAYGLDRLIYWMVNLFNRIRGTAKSE